MTKVYLLNQPLNASTFTIYTPGGNGVCYQFRGGNVTTKTPAWFMTDNEYYQHVLENSEQFKCGVVKYDKTTAIAVAKAKAEEAEAMAKANDDDNHNDDQVNCVESVTTVTEAINYVAEKWGEVAKTAKQAKDIANGYGVDFPNLKIGKR